MKKFILAALAAAVSAGAGAQEAKTDSIEGFVFTD